MPRQRIYSYQPTSGVRTDFKRLMNTFLKLNTVRYEQFSKVWREQNMSFLCAGRYTEREAREFIEKILLIAREYFLPPFQFQVRVGGLYLLYGIYQIQPLLPKVKIRITPSQWTDTVFFQEQAAQQNHLDIVYIFNRLLQEQAFHFCYTPDEISHFAKKQESDDNEVDLADDMKEEKSSIYKLFNYESMEKMSYLQNQYQQLKIGLAGPNASKPEKSLDVMHGELMEDLGVLLQTYNEKIASLLKSQKSVEKETGSEELLPDSSMNKRQKLKLQAYNQVTATSAKSTHNVVVFNPTSPQKRVSSTSPKKRIISPEKKVNQEATVRTEADVDNANLMFSMPILDECGHNSDRDYEPPKKFVTRLENQPSQNVKISKSIIKKTIPEQQLLENIMDKPVKAHHGPTLKNVAQTSSGESRLMDITSGKKPQIRFRFPSKICSSGSPSNETVHEVSSTSKTSQRLKSQPRKSTVEEIIVFPPPITQVDTTYDEGKFQKRGRPRTKNLIPPVINKCSSKTKEKRPKTKHVKEKSDSSNLSRNTVCVISPSNCNEQLILPTKGVAKKTKIDVQQISGNEIVVFPSKPVVINNLKANQFSAKSKPKNNSDQMIQTEPAMGEIVQEEHSGTHPEGKMSQGVSKMTNMIQKKPRDKTKEATVTEIVVGKKVGQPSTVQSMIVHNRQDSNKIKRNCVIEIDDEEDSHGKSSSNQVMNKRVGKDGGYKRKRSVEMVESPIAVKKLHSSAVTSNSTRGRRKNSPVSPCLQEGHINLTENRPIKTYMKRKNIRQSPCHTRVGESQNAVEQFDPRPAQEMGAKFIQKSTGDTVAEDVANQSYRNRNENSPKKWIPFAKGSKSTLQSETLDGISVRKKVEKKGLPFAYKFL